MIRFVLLAALAIAAAIAAAAQTAPTDSLAVAEAPAGPLEPAQLAQVAVDVRRLEAAPLAPDALDARRVLFNWLQASPDVNVTICPAAVAPLLDDPHPYKGELLTQFVLSSAASVIEQPPGDDEMVQATLGGLRGVLSTYRVLEEVGPDMEPHPFLEEVSRMQEDGQLETFVVQAAETCLRALEEALAASGLPLAPSPAVMVIQDCAAGDAENALAVCDPVFHDIDVAAVSLDEAAPIETGATAFVLDYLPEGVAISLVAFIGEAMQIEVNHLLSEPGIYAIEPGQAFLFALDPAGDVLTEGSSAGAATDAITITVYDPENSTLKGWLTVSLTSDDPDATTTHVSMEFAVRLQE